MTITATFDSLEEFRNFLGIAPPTNNFLAAAESARKEPEKAEPKKNTKKAQEAAEEDPREDAPDPGMPSAPEVSEDFRVDVRKTLTQLNKKVGKNIASELIKGFGVDKLTEVALADLPALMEKAKEALNAE